MKRNVRASILMPSGERRMVRGTVVKDDPRSLHVKIKANDRTYTVRRSSVAIEREHKPLRNVWATDERGYLFGLPVMRG